MSFEAAIGYALEFAEGTPAPGRVVPDKGKSPATGEKGLAESSTAGLLAMARTGDDGARDQLAARYLPVLRRWAHGRLPARARGLVDTDDLVNETMLHALDRVRS